MRLVTQGRRAHPGRVPDVLTVRRRHFCTYRIPGQATAYFYGYANLQTLRAKTELALGERFDQRSFHDFILAQGLLPPELLEQAVMQDFVQAQKEHAATAQTAR